MQNEVTFWPKCGYVLTKSIILLIPEEFCFITELQTDTDGSVAKSSTTGLVGTGLCVLRTVCFILNGYKHENYTSNKKVQFRNSFILSLMHHYN